jgi:hypothetical protein
VIVSASDGTSNVIGGSDHVPVTGSTARLPSPTTSSSAVSCACFDARASACVPLTARTRAAPASTAARENPPLLSKPGIMSININPPVPSRTAWTRDTLAEATVSAGPRCPHVIDRVRHGAAGRVRIAGCIQPSDLIEIRLLDRAECEGERNLTGRDRTWRAGERQLHVPEPASGFKRLHAVSVRLRRPLRADRRPRGARSQQPV